MSRNLARTDCYFCRSQVNVIEPPSLITKEIAHRYYEEYQGMMVAKAKCSVCGATYLAWLARIPSRPFQRTIGADGASEPLDLSFYSTFNDEPGQADMPTVAEALLGQATVKEILLAYLEANKKRWADAAYEACDCDDCYAGNNAFTMTCRVIDEIIAKVQSC